MLRAAAAIVTLAFAACAASTTPTLQSPVHYTRGGGIAGVRDELVIAPDGQARLTSRGVPTRRFRVSEADRRAIARALEDFASLPKDPGPGPPISDDFGYGVTYRGHTVSAQGANMPERVRPLFDRLGTIAYRHGLR